MNEPQRVHFEKSGQVRDESGSLIGSHDPHVDAKELRKLYSYVGDVSRGELRTLASPQGDLGPKDVQVAGTTITTFAKATETVADIVCPVSFVSKSSGTWFSEDPSLDLAQQVIPYSSATAAPPTLSPKLMSSTYDATSAIALSVEYSSETFDNADIDMAKLAIRRLVNALKLDREIRVANLLTTAANWPAGQQTAAAIKWNTVATATPLFDVFTALGKSYVGPTHLIMSETAVQYFYSNLAVYQHVTAGFAAENSSKLPTGHSSPLPTVIVAKKRVLSGGVATYVWGNTPANAVLVCAFENNQDKDTITTARTFRFIGDAPDVAAAQESDGYMLRSFFTQKHGARGGRAMVLIANDSDKLLSGVLGGIVTGVVA